MRISVGICELFITTVWHNYNCGWSVPSDLCVKKNHETAELLLESACKLIEYSPSLVQFSYTIATNWFFIYQKKTSNQEDLQYWDYIPCHKMCSIISSTYEFMMHWPSPYSSTLCSHICIVPSPLLFLPICIHMCNLFHW